MKKIIFASLTIVFLLIVVLFAYQLINKANQQPKGRKEAAVDPRIKILGENTVVFKQNTGFAVNRSVVSDHYVISYDAPFKTYTIEIKVNSIDKYHEAKKEAEKAFLDRGVRDICSLKILFVVPKEIREKSTQADIFATGCKSFL